MEQMHQILQGSMLWRLLCAIFLWFGRQWERSGIIHWFLNPAERVRGASESSVFFKLWNIIHGGLSKLYAFLRLDKLFAGSIFLKSAFWSGAVVVLSPFLPTMGVLALALVGYGSVALNLLRNKGKKLAYSPMNRYILLYAAVYLVGTWFSVTRSGSLKVGAITVAFILFSIVLQNSIATRRQLDTMIELMVLAGVLVALYGIFQYLTRSGYQSQAWVDTEMFSSTTFRVPSTFQNPNMLGQYFILVIPFGGACLLTAKDWAARGFWLVCCGILCVCMILTLSRGAWLGLLFAGLIFFVILNPKLIMLAPVALVALYFVMPDSIISRFTSIGNLSDSSTSYRVYIWMGAIAMLKDYWLCGIGPGDAAFNLVYPAYSYSGITAPHSHNLFLQILCDAGICALVVFLLILFQYFRHLCAAVAHETNYKSKIFQIAAISAIGGFMVQAMTDYSFYNYRVMFLFWVFLAVGSLLAGRTALPRRVKS